MYTNEIVEFLERKKMEKFVKVVASDCLPDRVSNNTGLIVNLSPSFEAGSHWVSIYTDSEGNSTYFCSYGMRPRVASILKFLKVKCRSVNFVDACLQRINSQLCGEYCLVFLSHALQYQTPLKSFLEMFSHNAVYNDWLVEKLFKRLKDFSH